MKRTKRAQLRCVNMKHNLVTVGRLTSVRKNEMKNDQHYSEKEVV
jgi:hypothetical protein